MWYTHSNNGVGMNGVAHNAKLMSLRAIPDGDVASLVFITIAIFYSLEIRKY